MLLSDAVRWSRLRHGWTQTELANRAGVSKATVSRIERHRLQPSAELVARLARVLGWSPWEVYVALVPDTPTTRHGTAASVSGPTRCSH